MTIFVTTGSAFPFDSLIKFLDQNNFDFKCKFIFQIGNGTYIPQNNEYYRFVENIENYFRSSNLVITHAGAGTVYKLLELEIPFIAVPNFDRENDHQKDIAQFLIRQKLSAVVFDFKQMADTIKNYRQEEFEKYNNSSEKIIEFIFESLTCAKFK